MVVPNTHLSPPILFHRNTCEVNREGMRHTEFHRSFHHLAMFKVKEFRPGVFPVQYDFVALLLGDVLKSRSRPVL